MGGDRWLPPSAPGAQAPRRWDEERVEVPSPPPTPTTVPGQPVAPAPAQPSNGQAVAALVLGICGLVFLVMAIGLLAPLSLPCSILAWVFGVKGRRLADRGLAGQRGLAQAGFVMGVVGTVLGVLALIAWAVVIATMPEFGEGGRFDPS